MSNVFANPTQSNSQNLTTQVWRAEMIRPLSDNGVGTPASFVEQRLFVEDITGLETLRISALGLYRCFINGERVGEDLLTPGWTAYDKRLGFQTYPVGHLLSKGENLIRIWLGDGWFRSSLMGGEFPVENTWGRNIAAIAEVFASHLSPEPFLITDTSWRSGELPIRKSGIYFGEVFDAQMAVKSSAGVAKTDFRHSTLVAQEAQPVRELDPLRPVKSWRDDQGRSIHDFGQNVGGYVAFSVKGAAGARIHIEHAEILDKEGQFYNVNFRSAEARIEYILAGRGEEHYRPIFTFQGFRFARVTIEGDAEVISIQSVPISSVSEIKAGFTCGNPLVDRLVLNTIWSQRGNFIDVPTDCPQRDERLGWTGDAQVFAGTACYFADSKLFLQKWLRDLMADQREDGAIPHFSPDPTRQNPSHHAGFFGSTGWGDAIAIVPWQLYLHYGDRAVLKETLPAMEKWVDFLWSISDGPIVSPPRELGDRGYTWGDWLQPKGPSAKPLPTIGDDAAATIYLYITSTLVARIAHIVGNRILAERMQEMSASVKSAFATEFITASGRLVYDDQTSYALAFLHDLIPENQRAAAKSYFLATIVRSDCRIGTGFIGTPALLPALVKIGELMLAGDLFQQEEVPGWLYQVKMGATTIWERWDAIQADGSIYNPQMNSYNHYAYGAVCQWLFEEVAGFRPDEDLPGFEKIIFAPIIIPSMSPVAAHHDSPRGRLSAAWSVDGDRVTYQIEVPEGCVGVLRLRPEYTSLLFNGREIGEVSEHSVAAGKHEITFHYSEPDRVIRVPATVHSRTP